MQASRIADATLVVAGLITAAAAVAIRHVGGVEAVAELVFAAVLVTSVLLVMRLAARAFRATLVQRSAARALQRRPTSDAVRQAVADERARLAADIEAAVRSSLRTMRGHAERALDDDDPVRPLREVQRLGREATAELRRLLGLLRDEQECPAPSSPLRTARTPWRADVALAVGTVTLAVVEHFVENSISGWLVAGARSPVAVAATAVAASMVVLRRRSPAIGAILCGLVFIAAATAGHPVDGGFWIIVGPAVLAYAAMRRLTWPSTCAALMLLAAVVCAFAWRDPVNLPINAETVLVAATVGMLVALADRRRQADRAAADGRAAELSEASARAVRAERLAVAREIHDVVSHAIGVMVMQAAAAELLWSSDQTRARAAVRVVRSVGAEATDELDELVAVVSTASLDTPPDATAGQGRPAAPANPSADPAEVKAGHDHADLAALVGRMRSAGLRVRVEAPAALGGDTGATAYRIVQEALTNVLRHAPGAAVAVAVHADESGLHIEVQDDGPGPGDLTRHGYGLAGISERVQRLGGTLYAGRARDGTGFRIDARLPA